jgi:hypothetical protein
MHEHVKASAAEVFEEIKTEQKNWVQQREVHRYATPR